MTNPHNVDICVTCVSERPPQLPLREELQSLGIEVVYNAHGVGAKATRHEQQRKLKKFQRDKHNNSRGLFGKLKQTFGDKEEKRREAELLIPHALSYSSYQRRLNHQYEGTKKGSEESSDETTSTAASPNTENDVDHYYYHLQDNQSATTGRQSVDDMKPPIKSLEIPTHSPEDIALQAAFNAFADTSINFDDKSKQIKREALFEVSAKSNNSATNATPPESRQPSHSTGVTTMSSFTDQDYHIRVEAETESMKEPLFGLTERPSGRKSEDYEAPSVQSLEDMAAAYLSKYVTPVAATTGSQRTDESRPSDEGDLSRVQIIESEEFQGIRKLQINLNDKMADFYDLTSISDDEKPHSGDEADVDEEYDDTSDESKDLSTLSSGRDVLEDVDDGEITMFGSSALEHRQVDLRYDIPEEEDEYGRIVMDLSDVMEVDGPGSPLVYSPVNMYGEVDLMQSPTRHMGFFEKRQDDDILESPQRYDFGMRRDSTFDDFAFRAEVKLSALRQSRGKSLFDDASSIGFSQSSPRHYTHNKWRNDNRGLMVDSSLRESYSGDSHDDAAYERSHTHDETSPGSLHHSFLPTASPRKFDDEHDTMRSIDEDDDPICEPRSPTLVQSFSRESDVRSKLSVSFSNDIDAHYYDDDEEVASYEEIVKLVDKIEHGGLLSFAHSSNEDSADQKFAAILNRDRTDESFQEPENLKPPIIQLQEALRGEGPIPHEAGQIVRENPGFIREKIEGTDIYPLHAACALPFPSRFETGRPCSVKDLVCDISERQKLIVAFVHADATCCTYLDSKNNLPVHIISRLLMEWEAKWYQKVYERAREDDREHNGSGEGITTLYKTMSQVVDVLLKPLAEKQELCQQAGGMGYLLPLHIAAIFTVSYNTLKAVIEKYPAAASQKCNLDNIRTFIPNYSTPLELHSRLSTDFPKWEIESSHSQCEEDIHWTQSRLDQSYRTTGGMRRSDLMFAFYPDISPYRHETARIRRLEERIRSEVESLQADEGLSTCKELSMAARLVWEWMCTYEGDHKEDNYADSVRKIVDSLPLESVKLLVATPNQHGRAVIDCARSECTQAIQDRLDVITSTMVPVPIDVLSTGFASRQRCFFLREWEENMASKFCLRSRGFVGVVCRTLFNIADVSFPSNFVILPYKLVKDSDGRLGLESAEAAAVAMKFADCLLHLTDPTKILHFLEKKAIRFNGTSLGIEASHDWDRVEAKTKQQVSKLLSLYAKGQGHLYFIDEYTGVPIVPEGESLYPLLISDAMDTVRRVLPLMMTGMILMRGEKALSVLANVLLNERITMVQDHWIEAAKDLVGYLYSPQTEWTPNFLNDLRPLRGKLVDFIERGVSEGAPSIPPEGLLSEWVVELSLLKMIVEMYDTKHTLSGLHPRRAGKQVLWTQETSFLDPQSRGHLLQMDFKSLSELRELSEELNEKDLRQRKKKDFEEADKAEQEKDHDKKHESSTSRLDLYELLFQDLAYPVEEMEKSDEEAKESESRAKAARQNPQLILSDERFRISRRKMRYASAAEPISLLNFDDDDLDLDEVLQIRILIDEQEAKLDFLREKVSDLEVAEKEFLEQEIQVGEILDQVNNQKDILMMNSNASTKGLSSARRLLMRICDLEERISMSEVELGHLKNGILCLELEASSKASLDVLYEII